MWPGTPLSPRIRGRGSHSPSAPQTWGSQIGQVPKSGGESSARLARLAARGAGTPPSAIGKPESLDLGGGITLELVTVPAGEFVMGDAAGYPDEQPPVRVRIARPFAIGKLEVTNEQFRRFDPTHDSGVANWLNKDQYLRGYPLNGPKQPVVRVSWIEHGVLPLAFPAHRPARLAADRGAVGTPAGPAPPPRCGMAIWRPTSPLPPTWPMPP